MQANHSSASTVNDVGPHSTHELTELTIAPSSLARRSAAYILDCVIFLVSMAMYAGTALFTPLPTVLGPWEYVLVVLPSYFVLSEGMFGKTLGKHLFKLAVVKTDGSPIDLGTSLVRNFLRLIDGLPFAAIASPYPVGVISILASPLNQRVGDRVAKTVVVYVPLESTSEPNHELYPVSIIDAPPAMANLDDVPPTDNVRPTLDILRAQWETIINTVQLTDRRTAALLRDVYPSALDEKLLTLKTPFEFHLASLSTPDRINQVEAALLTTTHSSIRCRIEIHPTDVENSCQSFIIDPLSAFDDHEPTLDFWKEPYAHEPSPHDEPTSSDELTQNSDPDHSPPRAFHLHPNDWQFDSETIRDEHLSLLDSITIIHLNLTDSQVTDDGLASLARLQNLAELVLWGTRITDQGLEQLSNVSTLRFLNLRGTSITNEGLSHLFKLYGLERINLTGTTVTSDGIQRLQEAIPGCDVVQDYDFDIISNYMNGSLPDDPEPPSWALGYERPAIAIDSYRLSGNAGFRHMPKIEPTLDDLDASHWEAKNYEK